MHIGRTGEAYFGDEALLRDGDAAAAAAAAEEGGGGGEAAATEAATDDAAADAAAEAEEPLIFAQDLDAAESVSAAKQSLVRCGRYPHL